MCSWLWWGGVSCVGALHRYRVSLNDPVMMDKDSATKVQTRALMPVALPRGISDSARALRNKCE